MRRALAALALAVLAGACGSTAPPTPTPQPSTGPLTAVGLPSPFHMKLDAQLDLATLAAAVQVQQAGELLAEGQPSHEAGALSGSACWGYTSPNGRRFALTGVSTGLSIVEVTNPLAARPIALVLGGESPWREVKSYGHYAYVTTEAKTGLDIVDLADPDRPRKVQTWNRTFNSAHTLWIDAERGLLFANGTSSGMHVLDLRNPEEPVDVGRFTAYYVHDSYTRGTTLFASAIRNGFVALLDVADPANIRETTHFATGGSFTHNSWLTGNGRYLFTTDEVAGRPVEGWDIADPTKPRKVAEYIGRPGTIPHNVMIDGDRLLISHYTEGVHLLDIRDPEQPRVLGLYDTYTGAGTGFHGAWGAYIFPGSNLILASDIEGGLFVVEFDGAAGS